MRKSSTNSLLLLCILLISFNSCKKCEYECERGYCSKGECVCITGWAGQTCGDQKTPSYLVIDSIKVNYFRALNSDGGTWDTVASEENPDLVLWLRYGALNTYQPDFVTTEEFKNADGSISYVFKSDFPLKLTSSDFTREVNLYVSDHDPETYSVQFIGGYHFYFYYNTNNFERVRELKEEGYHTSYTIYQSYIFG